MERGKKIWVSTCVALVAILFITILSGFTPDLCYWKTSQVKINLQEANSAGFGEKSWRFEVNGQPVGFTEDYRFYDKLIIDVFEVQSGKKIDSFDIGEKVKGRKRVPLVFYELFGPCAVGGIRLDVSILYGNGEIKRFPVDIFRTEKIH